MGLPRIKYDAGAGVVQVDFVRGPHGFRCYYEARLHDNVATSGLRERVFEHADMFIGFGTLIQVSTDLAAWCAWAKWALGGGQFSFRPNTDLADEYHVVLEDDGWELERVAPGLYRAQVVMRVVPDAAAPADVSVVMKRFYGIA